MLHTYELGIVSMGKFIDTLSLSHSLLDGETVNCCQHIEDLKAIGNSQYHNMTVYIHGVFTIQNTMSSLVPSFIIITNTIPVMSL